MRPNEDAARAAVRAAMHTQSIEVAQLARATKLDPGTITDFLNGTRWPRVASLAKLDNYFGWTPGYLATLATSTKSETVSSDSQDDGVLLDVDPSVVDGLTRAERDEVLAHAKATYLQRAREIRRERG